LRGGIQPPDSNGSPFAQVAHRHPAIVNNHRNFSPALGKRQHLFQCVGIIDDADVFNRLVVSCAGLTGG
jgi:hypothetical protein